MPRVMAMLCATSSCPRCTSPLVEIRLPRAGSTVTMRSCSRCDTRYWDEGGSRTSLTAVLDGMVTDRLSR